MCIHALSLLLLIPHPLIPLLILLLRFSRLGPKFRPGKRLISMLANGDFNNSQPQGLLSVFLISKDFCLEKAKADRNLDLLLYFVVLHLFIHESTTSCEDK